MKRKRQAHRIMIHAPDGYYWVGKRCLPDSEVWGDYGKLLQSSCCNIRDFRTTRKARNVLMELPKDLGAQLYREYWTRGNKVSPHYTFNSQQDADNFDQGGPQ